MCLHTYIGIWHACAPILCHDCVWLCMCPNDDISQRVTKSNSFRSSTSVTGISGNLFFVPARCCNVSAFEPALTQEMCCVGFLRGMCMCLWLSLPRTICTFNLLICRFYRLPMGNLVYLTVSLFLIIQIETPPCHIWCRVSNCESIAYEIVRPSVLV